MAINVKKACGVNPALLEKGRVYGEARITSPDDGALTGLRFHENEGHLTQGSGSPGEMEGDAFTPKVTAVEFRQVVVAHTADVMSAQPPALAGDNGGGNLAAKHNLRVESFDL